MTRDYVLGLDAFLIGGQRIRAGRRTMKGVTGYDVTGLLVGSEGTLGVFGDITLQLIPKPESVMTMMTLFSNVQQAGAAVQEIIALGLVEPALHRATRCNHLGSHAQLGEFHQRAGRLAMLIMEVDGDEQAC